ncbi:MAG: anthranilate synthase component II, partial [Bacteroidota bacterium]
VVALTNATCDPSPVTMGIHSNPAPGVITSSAALSTGTRATCLRSRSSLSGPVLAQKLPVCLAWGVGPGPARPQDYPHLMRAIAHWIGKKPLLGICLGQQAIAQVCGWQIDHAAYPMHGKPSLIDHNRQGLFEGLPTALQVGRYHSLVATSPSNLSAVNIALNIDARCDEEIMALSNAEMGVWAVQFHPESVLTPQGQAMINRWVKLADAFNRSKD